MSSSFTFLPAATHGKRRGRIDWAGIAWLYLFFWYFSGLMQALMIPTAGFVGFRNVFFLSAIWLAPVLLFPRWTRQIAAALGIVLWATSLVSIGYWGIYGQEFSQSVIFTIFESNMAESGEYLSQYVSLRLLVGVAAYSIVAFLLWRRLRPVDLPRPVAVGAAVFVVLTNLASPYLAYLPGKIDFPDGTIKLQRRLEPATPWHLLMGYYQYRHQLDNVQALLQGNAALPPVRDLIDANGDTPRTLVLVIGESTTSRRMSLYGYPRKTTPHLDALKERGELITFNNVITSRPYTIEILRQALTFANEEAPNRFLTEPNLMNVMKQAGYKTFWITNQQTMTQRNTLLTVFSQQADEVRYLNSQRVQNATLYDQIVFEPFAASLQDPAPKKFIVVHLLGTHAKYLYRYPREYATFNTRDNAPASLTDSQLETYNSYDNAVLYNDFVVSSLIDTFAASKADGFLVYFSDHGEEVFHESPHQILGRNEAAPTPDMYAVPFILWAAPSWKKTHDVDFAAMADRRYSNADFIHTWSDLAGLRYDRFQPERSLVNPDFVAHTRWIGNPDLKNGLRDYDAIMPVSPPILTAAQISTTARR
ncbi:MAG: phosphoethanolamine transferase CptA [Azoarcus sp.]|jgi:heptose-I-phosphate ethanolaminephosphotransferase|nr:phosphoethanolamine transferase CptA [Azoarcus sp.]